MKKFYIVIGKKDGAVPLKNYYLTKQQATNAVTKLQQQGYQVTSIISTY